MVNYSSVNNIGMNDKGIYEISSNGDVGNFYQNIVESMDALSAVHFYTSYK